MTDDNSQNSKRKGFQPGQSGNPAGRPPGTRNKTLLALECLMDGEALELTRKVVEDAKNGDSVAMRLCMDRIFPPRKDRPVRFKIPNLAKASDAVQASAAIVQAVAEGELSPSEASELSKVVQGWIEALKASDHDERLARIEEALAGDK
ncbi:hypothetical protein SLNSH_22840 [Alsobacter soli]|uniref:DUF5681 domain-containing protein n=1 Tax=Alsobacter soli TaxID=2109933 RepID=A0A2T1HM87_9HYPH|nr:DUF5681 domain-containing protein [Alsobacter soli]PSC02701.1 hypothetical protein SLNSH_22840 [Alsobacter soli]